jgi:hypothetical protein
MDDHSVGETISGDPGGAWPLDVVAIHFDSGTHELRNLRFSHITCPIWCDYETTITARNLQMIDTFNPFFFMSTSTLNVYNLLARDFCFLYGGDAVTFRGEHITAHRGYEFGSLWSPGSSSAMVKNSLLVAIETPLNVGTYSLQGVGLLSDATVELQKLTNGFFTKAEADRLEGNLIDAAASADHIQIYGRKKFYDEIFIQEASFRYFQDWKKSERAQPWLKWAEANGQP